MSNSHWVLGGGRVGCLYDFGPFYFETLDETIDFAEYEWDLNVDERNDLRWNKHINFNGPEIDYLEVQCVDGPIPENVDLA